MIKIEFFPQLFHKSTLDRILGTGGKRELSHVYQERINQFCKDKKVLQVFQFLHNPNGRSQMITTVVYEVAA